MDFRLVIIAEDISYPRDEGVKKATFELIESLANKVASVFVITSTNERVGQASVLVARKNKIGFMLDALRYLNQTQPAQIIYIPFGSLTFFGFLRAIIIKFFFPLSRIVLIGLQYRIYGSYYRWLGFSNMIDVVFAHSPVSVKALEEAGFNAHFLPLAINLEKFHSVSQSKKMALRDKYSFSKDASVVLHVGHLNAGRNIELLVSLVEAGFFVVIVGSTSTFQDKKLMHTLIAKGINILPDYVEDIQELYQLADCYVFPVVNNTSAIEIPLSVLEAMACNLPVVTTDFGGLPGLFLEADGFYYLDKNRDLISLLHIAINTPVIGTRQMVTRYSWNTISSKLLEELGQQKEK